MNETAGQGRPQAEGPREGRWGRGATHGHEVRRRVYSVQGHGYHTLQPGVVEIAAEHILTCQPD